MDEEIAEQVERFVQELGGRSEAEKQQLEQPKPRHKL
jgi:hypothetical protein